MHEPVELTSLRRASRYPQEPVESRALHRQGSPLCRLAPRRPEPARPAHARHCATIPQEPQRARQDGARMDSCVLIVRRRACRAFTDDSWLSDCREVRHAGQEPRIRSLRVEQGRQEEGGRSPRHRLDVKSLRRFSRPSLRLSPRSRDPHLA